MIQTRNDLQTFNMACLRKIRKIRRKKYLFSDPYELFWNELEAILRTKHPSQRSEWEKLENNQVILGEVWSQPIGEFYYNHTVHKFTYLYIGSEDLAIAEHGHEEPANNGKQVKKIKEWYVFPDGTMSMCAKDEKHKLFNHYGEPIYVLSVKISSKGTR